MKSKVFLYEDAFKQSLEYFNGDELAANVFLGKYALKDDLGNILEPTPEYMHHRLAKEFARIEAKYPNPLTEEEIFNYLDRFKYIIPQGSPMSAIGNPYQIQSLSNCFVIETGDSYGAICKADEQLAQIMKRRGGVGLDISSIRPKGMSTKNAAGTTDGIGVFMERFSNTCREVAQNGRRGAEMQTISVHHPEVETFINIKKDLKKVTGANISVRMSDEFLRAVEADGEYEQRWPVDSDNPKITKKVKAKPIWDQFVEAATNSAEPGILFWDNIIKNSPADSYKVKGFETVGTNPCSELPLSLKDSCRLLLINVLSFVENPWTNKASFNWKEFSRVSQQSQRLMDDLVDLELEAIDKILAKVESDPEPEDVKRVEKELWTKIKEACANGRRTGLGMTAIGDAVAAMGPRYGSESSIELVEKICKTLCLNSYRTSVDLAKERGSFPVFSHDLEKDNEFLKRVWSEDKELHGDYLKNGRRNISNLTIAPCGSVSILTQTTSGIEPVYRTSYTRRKKINPNDKQARVDFTDDLGDKWQEFKMFHHGLQKWMDINNKTEADIEQSPYWKSTSHDIDWISGVKLQAGAQKWIDHAISRCLTEGESFVQTDRGLFDISELAGHAERKSHSAIDYQVSSINSRGELSKIISGYNNGVERVLRIRLNNGKEISATPLHCLFVLSPESYEPIWKPIKELKKGDVVVGRKGMNLWNEEASQCPLWKLVGSKFSYVRLTNSKEINFPDRMNASLSRFMGYMCSDGSVGQNGISLSQLRNNVVEDFSKLVKELFGIETTIVEDKRTNNLVSVIANSRELVSFCRWLGLTGHGEEMRVPLAIRKGTKIHAKEFIRGVTLDGYVSKNNLAIETSVSKIFLVQIQNMLLNMGIESNLLKCKNAGKEIVNNILCDVKDCWVLLISRSDEAARYMSMVGFAENRKNEEFISKFYKSPRVKLGGEIPDNGLRLLFRKTILPVIKSNSLYEKFHSLTCADKQGKTLNRDSILEMVDLGMKAPEILIDPTYTFNEIHSIEDDGFRQTFDITVPNGQSYIVNGIISHNTQNLPETATKEEVSKIYLEAWHSGCKGFTVYRDGSRSGVLVSSDNTVSSSIPSAFEEHHSPKRPKELLCDIYHSTVQGEKWTIFVGLLGNKPYEIMGGLSKYVNIPKRVKSGKIIKHNGEIHPARYDLIYDYNTGNSEDETSINDLGNIFENPLNSAFSRTLSLALRHGTPVQYVVEQLVKGSDKESDMFSFSKVTSRVLKNYVKDGTKATQKKCPECGGTELAFQEGCVKCVNPNCGFTKCG